VLDPLVDFAATKDSAEEFVEAVRTGEFRHENVGEMREALGVSSTDELVSELSSLHGAVKQGRRYSPKMRPSGKTTLMNDIIDEASTVALNAGKKPIEIAAATKGIAKIGFPSVANYIDTLGSAGKLISDDIRDIDFVVTKKANNDMMDTREVFKGLTAAGRVKLAKLVNGRIKPADASASLNERAVKWRKILDRAMNEARDIGMKRNVGGKKIAVGGSGKAIPQIPNSAGVKFLDAAHAKGQADVRVFVWAQGQVTKGKYETVAEAVNALNRFRDQSMRGYNRYLESERVELPEEFLEWDMKHVMPNLYKNNWMTVESVRKWGNKYELIDSRTETIKGEIGTDEAERVKSYIEVAFGKKRAANKWAQGLSNNMRAYQFHTKVAASPLTIYRNTTDRFSKMLTLSQHPGVVLKVLKDYPPFLNMFIKSAQAIEEDMIRRGAVFAHGSLAEGYEAGSAIGEMITQPFGESEIGNQVHIGLTKYIQLRKDLVKLNALTKGELAKRIEGRAIKPFGKHKFQDPVVYRVKEMGGDQIIEALVKGEPVTEDMIDRVIHDTVKNKAYPQTLATKPIWYDQHPMVKAMIQFKTWPVRDIEMIWRDVIKYTTKTGDPSRLIGFLVGIALTGEIYNIARDWLYNKDESVLSALTDDEKTDAKEIGIRILSDMFDGSGFGLVTDFTYGVFDWVKGVPAGTAKNVKEFGTAVVKQPSLAPEALRRLIEKEATPARQVKALIDKIDKAFFNRNNITEEYYKYRAAAFEYKDGYLSPTWKEKAIGYHDDIFWGGESHKPGKNTLTHQMLARQIVVGDYGDAVKYAALALKSEDESSLKSIMKSFYSPVGPVKEGRRRDFYKELGAPDGAEARNIQNNFERQVDKIVRVARRRPDVRKATRERGREERRSLR
jgi:hypothetical protein